MATVLVLLALALGTEPKPERTISITSIEHHEGNTEHPYRVEARTSREPAVFYKLECKSGAADLEVGRLYKATEETEGGTKILWIYFHIERDPTIIATTCDVESAKTAAH
jgi:hypothetical protein